MKNYPKTMKLALIQEKQNELYNFVPADSKIANRQFSFAETEKLQNQMFEQNLALMEKAAGNADFLLSSEAINFPGQHNCLDFPAYDLVNKNYNMYVEKLSDLAQGKNIYAKSRAYENGVYVAGAMAVPLNSTISGIRSPSNIIDPEGNVIIQAGNDTTEFICCDIDLKKEWETNKYRS